MPELKSILIYSDYPSYALSMDGIFEFLQNYGLKISNRGNFVNYLNLSDGELIELAEKISGAIVQDINRPNDKLIYQGNYETKLEHSRLLGDNKYKGVFYDGSWLQRILYTLFSEKIPAEMSFGHINLIFTSRLFGTFDKKRYHARVILMGMPTLISTSGIVEAPARPKDYYFLKAGFIQSGKEISELDQIYKGRFIEYDDSRITSVLGAYALQSIAYEVMGEEFCDNSSCCLHNSHWQEEVINTQLEGKLCSKHQRIILGLSDSS